MDGVRYAWGYNGGVTVAEIASRIPEGWGISDVSLAAQNDLIKRVEGI